MIGMIRMPVAFAWDWFCYLIYFMRCGVGSVGSLGMLG